MTYFVMDTSQGTTSLAITRGRTVAAVWNDDTPNQQSAQLVIQADRLLHTQGLAWSELGGIVCTTGPGGFTSVRIAIAAARGFALAAGVLSHGVSVPEIMAWSVMQRTGMTHLCVVLPAGRSECVWQYYEWREGKAVATSALSLCSRDALASKTGKRVVCVPHSMEYEDADALRVDMRSLAPFLAEYLVSDAWKPEDYPPPTPLYARPPDAAIAAPLLKHG
jgi:tRNA threonylcarbamoyladenosine biosynthesis protein TsaB